MPAPRKVKFAEPLQDFMLRVGFQDGTEEIVDIKPLIEQHKEFGARRSGRIWDLME